MLYDNLSPRIKLIFQSKQHIDFCIKLKCNWLNSKYLKTKYFFYESKKFTKKAYSTYYLTRT